MPQEKIKICFVHSQLMTIGGLILKNIYIFQNIKTLYNKNPQNIFSNANHNINSKIWQLSQEEQIKVCN